MPALDPRALHIGLPLVRRQGAHRFLDAGGELARSLLCLWGHGFADADPDLAWDRERLMARHHLERALDVHGNDRRARLLGQVANSGLELLDAAVRRPAALWKQHEVPARLQQLAR